MARNLFVTLTTMVLGRVRCFVQLEPANTWIASIISLESALQLKSWYARVGASSNVSDDSDGPSRLDFSAPLLRGIVRARPSLDSLLRGWGFQQ